MDKAKIEKSKRQLLEVRRKLKLILDRIDTNNDGDVTAVEYRNAVAADQASYRVLIKEADTLKKEIEKDTGWKLGILSVGFGTKSDPKPDIEGIDDVTGDKIGITHSSKSGTSNETVAEGSQLLTHKASKSKTHTKGESKESTKGNRTVKRSKQKTKEAKAELEITLEKLAGSYIRSTEWKWEGGIGFKYGIASLGLDFNIAFKLSAGIKGDLDWSKSVASLSFIGEAALTGEVKTSLTICEVYGISGTVKAESKAELSIGVTYTENLDQMLLKLEDGKPLGNANSMTEFQYLGIKGSITLTGTVELELQGKIGDVISAFSGPLYDTLKVKIAEKSLKLVDYEAPIPSKKFWSPSMIVFEEGAELKKIKNQVEAAKKRAMEWYEAIVSKVIKTKEEITDYSMTLNAEICDKLADLEIEEATFEIDKEYKVVNKNNQLVIKKFEVKVVDDDWVFDDTHYFTAIFYLKKGGTVYSATSLRATNAKNKAFVWEHGSALYFDLPKDLKDYQYVSDEGEDFTVSMKLVYRKETKTIEYQVKETTNVRIHVDKPVTIEPKETVDIKPLIPKTITYTVKEGDGEVSWIGLHVLYKKEHLGSINTSANRAVVTQYNEYNNLLDRKVRAGDKLEMIDPNWLKENPDWFMSNYTNPFTPGLGKGYAGL